MSIISSQIPSNKSGKLRLALAQMNSHVGNLEKNTQKILEFIDEAKKKEADLVVFPELAITGYPPEDLLLKPGFLRDNLDAMNQIIAATLGITAVVGFVDVQEDILNAAAVLHDGKMVGAHHKFYLPNYGVFDEDRYFRAGTETSVYTRGGITFGVAICEDIWYPEGPTRAQALLGNAQLALNINASPFYAGKWRFREQMLTTRASDNGVILAYVNAVGGQDELVFDGQSVVIAPNGDILARGKAFEEELILADIDTSLVTHSRLSDPRRRKVRLGSDGERTAVEQIQLSELPATPPKKEIAPSISKSPERLEEVYQGLVVGTRDYVLKNGFKHVVLGLSGGIDSAIVAVIAVDALGVDKVTGVTMPSQYTSTGTRTDAEILAQNLGIEFITLPIGQVFESYKSTLSPAFEGRAEDLTEENLQARIRGNLLMALSNKFGWMVLTTGNKSEMAVGYSTLYGDMAGGFAVIKDVPKTLVYELSEYRNKISPVIPKTIITRPPSAELRPDQKDEDSLPPYSILDPIIHHYVVEDRSFEEIVSLGFQEETVRRVMRLIDRSEYKRRQAPPGIKITPKAFGKDRRLPITNGYRE